jgi:regulator of protease activity HflC (stomatin/prohibitin superfamily)
MPFIDRVAYKHSQKEIVRDVPRQSCITKDNIEVSIDGVMYLQVIDPKAASYGVDDYVMAAQQLAQTTLRSVIGKIDLDKTFEERGEINMEVVRAVDEAAQPWGVKVLRYEVADINLPVSIKDAMEKQVRAERERRAVVAESEGERQAAINRSEGDRQAAINRSEGEKQEMINISEGEKMKQINEAEGRARQIELIATATAEGLRQVAGAVKEDGGEEAVSLRIAEQYVSAFEKVAKESTTLLLPQGLSDIGGAVAGLQKVLKTVEKTPA